MRHELSHGLFPLAIGLEYWWSGRDYGGQTCNRKALKKILLRQQALDLSQENSPVVGVVMRIGDLVFSINISFGGEAKSMDVDTEAWPLFADALNEVELTIKN